MWPSTSLLLGAAAIATMTAARGTFWPPPSTGCADPDDERQVALGSAVYRQHCASCHGAKLEGQPDRRVRKPDGRLPAPPHDETGHTWHHPDETLFRIAKLGLRPQLAPEGHDRDMPAFGPTLRDAEIWAVLAFIKSRRPVDTRALQSRLNQRGHR